MAAKIRRVEYFHCNVDDRPGEAHRVLSDVAASGVNLLAFTAVPVGPNRVQMTLFPDEVSGLTRAAREGGMPLDGPHRAILVQGDDELGALCRLHRQLAEAEVNVFASSGVTDGQGGFGYVIYVKPEDFDEAARVLGV